MLEINTGVTGAKRQSWRRANPRDVLKRLLDKSPELTEEQAELECWEIIHKDVSQMRTVYEYWFANNFHSLMHPRPLRQSGASSRLSRRMHEQIEEHIEEKVEEKFQIILLDMELPTGKQLRASTREELLECGGWMQRVAERLKPNQTVGQAGISEQQLRELYTE